MYDVFVSYEHESKAIADTLVALMERNNIRCWYAPRDVIGDYATSIVEAINQCRVFVLILNKNASDSPHVLNEVEMAYRRIIQGGFTVIPFRVSDDILSQAMEYYVKRLHWIDAHSEPLDRAADKLISTLNAVLHKEEDKKSQAFGRVKNPYSKGTDGKEEKRLSMQQSIVRSFDQDVYSRLLEGKQELHVLDLGSNDGTMVMDRLGTHPAVAKIIGVEYDAGVVAKANQAFKSSRVVFYSADLESDQIGEKLEAILKEQEITGFDFLNVSFLILHLMNPAKVLKTVRKVMNEGAIIFIRDVDDGLNFAYPDNEGMFARAIHLVEQCVDTGFRRSGRQIYHYLHKIGAKNIILEKIGPSTIGMNFKERTALFHTYFSFIPDSLRLTLETKKRSADLEKEYQWILSAYDDLETEFCDPSFVFQLGMMIFTATF